MGKQGFGESQCERAIDALYTAAWDYCQGYANATHSVLGEDHYIGAEGMRPILEGILVLLNGPSGELDRAAMDRKVRDLAVRIKMIDSDTREF